MKYYKVLGNGGVACNGGIGKWHLSKNGNPGKWMPKIEKIEPCESGYHLCRREDLIFWLNEEIYEAEGRGEFIVDEEKVVFQEARLIKQVETWNERTARLFAADCAERVLPIFEKEFPNDARPRKAIQAARDFVNGKIDRKEMGLAGAAAWAAARDAAGDAAGDAAWAAAWAGAAARDAERKWQTERLFEYLEGKT